MAICTVTISSCKKKKQLILVTEETEEIPRSFDAMEELDHSSLHRPLLRSNPGRRQLQGHETSTLPKG
jgi:hypothetical protein